MTGHEEGKGTDVADYDYPSGSAPCMCHFSTAEGSGPDPIGECLYHAQLRAQLDARRNIDRYVSFALVGDESVNPQDAADRVLKKLEDMEAEANAWRAKTRDKGESARQLKAKLDDALLFIDEIRAESVEDFRTKKYVVVQMTTETWERLKGG